MPELHPAVDIAVQSYASSFSHGLQPEDSVLHYHGGRIAQLTIDTLLALPVERRMELMGMRPVVRGMAAHSYTGADVWVESRGEWVVPGEKPKAEVSDG